MSARHDIEQAAAVTALLRASTTAARLRSAAEEVRLLECQRDDADAILRAIGLIAANGNSEPDVMAEALDHAIGMAQGYMRRWRPAIPADFPVKPLGPNDAAKARATCGACGRSWDDAIATGYTPVPSGRCPFEAFH